MHVDNVTFVYGTHKNVLLVAACHHHPNPGLIFEYLFEKLGVMRDHLGKDFNDATVLANLDTIDEIFHERLEAKKADGNQTNEEKSTTDVGAVL